MEVVDASPAGLAIEQTDLRVNEGRNEFVRVARPSGRDRDRQVAHPIEVPVWSGLGTEPPEVHHSKDGVSS